MHFCVQNGGYFILYLSYTFVMHRGKPLKLYASIMTCSFSLPTQCFVFSSTGLHAELIQKDKRNKHTSYIAGIS